MDLQSFMKNQQTSSEAMDLLHEKLLNASSAPYFMCARGMTDDDYYSFSLRSRKGPRLEYQVTDSNIPGAEFKIAVFGQVLPCSYQRVVPAPASGLVAMQETMTYDGCLRDVFHIGIPERASPMMSVSYYHQMMQMKNICYVVSQWTNLLPPILDPSLSFELVGPAYYKMNSHPVGEPVVFNDRPAVDTATDDIHPEDQLFDVHQIRRPASLSFDVMSVGTTALFEGSLRFWVSQGRMEVRFFADVIKVIARGGDEASTSNPVS